MVLGPAEIAIIFLILVLSVVGVVIPIVAAVDASKYPEWAFERAGTSKTLWIVLPVVGIAACGLISIGAAIAWYSSVKPRVVAATGSGPLPP